MNVGDIFQTVAESAVKNPVLLIAILLGIGSLVGSIKIRGVGLGPAAVLFTALAFSAWNAQLVLPQIVGNLGLAFFAYTVGLSAGPSFFGLLRRGSKVIAYTVAVLVVAGVVVALGADLLGLTRGVAAGVFAGSLTNTPALAAANEQISGEDPIVGYSLTYLYGVLGMLIFATLALRSKKTAPETSNSLVSRNVRVEREGLPDLTELAEDYDQQVVFSRIMRGDTPEHPGVVEVATPNTVPAAGDILTVVGDPDTVAQVISQLGHSSTVALHLDRRQLDSRQFTVSNTKLSGTTVEDLRLERTFSATATRVSRGDVGLLATDDLALLVGDRVTVVAPASQMEDIGQLFGDSETKASSVNAAGLGLGLSLGVLLGMLIWPLPGGAHFSLGVAGGSLLMGLILGRAMRTGPIVWSVPTLVSNAIGQVGMLLFLAYAGSVAGPALVKAFRDDQVWLVIALGAFCTTLVGALLLVLARFVGKLSAPATAGAIAGAATQPAVLAHANTLSGSPSVNVGYALVYPAAMIVKVLIAPLIGTLLF